MENKNLTDLKAIYNSLLELKNDSRIVINEKSKEVEIYEIIDDSIEILKSLYPLQIFKFDFTKTWKYDKIDKVFDIVTGFVICYNLENGKKILEKIINFEYFDIMLDFYECIEDVIDYNDKSDYSKILEANYEYGKIIPI